MGKLPLFIIGKEPKMAVAIYPGTFDPITLGHVDIAKRASKIFTRVIALVSVNPNKKTLFSDDERLALARESLSDVPHIEVIKYGGLVIDAMKEFNASTIIRGIRAVSDMDYEFQMAFTNRQLNNNAETVFLMPSAEFTYLSSSLVRNLVQFDGEISSFVTPVVEKALIKKVRG
jgi:pantetheine-phosphate adenylyltransferase